MKVISYSLFGDPNSFEFDFYLRGIYFNARMNRLIYPDWETWIFVDGLLHNSHYDILIGLQRLIKGMLVFEPETPERCAGMLWRLIPIFSNGVTHVMARDADAITTYREAVCIHDWLGSDMPFHAINDNHAHSGLMGGMVAFRAKDFKEATGYTSFDGMVSGLDLKAHGSDQNFMMKSIHPKIKNGLFMHNLSGAGCEARYTSTDVNPIKNIGIDRKLWESSNTCRFIGSPGVVDFELLRFFKRFDNDPKFDDFEKRFPDIFYWQL